MTVRLAMRFTEVDADAELERYLRDPLWVMEQKHDGTRVLASIRSHTVEFFNAAGTPLAHTAATQHLDDIIPALGLLVGDVDGEIVVDGELMIDTGEYRLFDVPYVRFGDTEVVLPTDPFEVRRSLLDTPSLVDALRGSPVSVTRQARTEQEKRALWHAVQLMGAEGVMVKYREGRYEPGQRVHHQLKVKLVKTADVVVTEVTRPDPQHGTIEFAVFRFPEPGTASPPEPMLVGRCSAIGKPPVEVGDVIEVRYLYYTGTTLYQPRMVMVRTDKKPEDCTMAQFPVYSRAVV